MSENKPSRQRTVMGLFLIAAVVLGLVLLFAWKGLRATHSVSNAGSAEAMSAEQKALPQRPHNRSPMTGRAAAHPAVGRRSVQRMLAYGSGEAELGFARLPEMEAVGPESFVVARDGSILVADVAKHRLAVYSRDGEYLRSIALPGIALGDVTTDAQGRIYVYDQASRTLYQYDADGTRRSVLNLNPKDIDTRGYFHVVGNVVYFADAAERDVLVATVQDDGLAAASPSAARITEGIHAESGRVYSLTLDRGQAVQVGVRDVEQATASTIEIPWPGVVSVRYAGEDETGRFYVQTERVDGGRVALEVLAFNTAGDLLSVTPLPENDYAIWTARLVDVRGDGTIVQFVPQKAQARLNLFTN